MKNHKITRLAMFITLTPFISAAAEEPTKKPAAAEERIESGTIAAAIRDGATFSILSKALVAADLDQVLGTKGTYTLFAPTDEAFGKLPEGTLDKLMLPQNKEKLRSLLLYHVVPGKLMAADLKNGEITTSNGEKVEIDMKANDTVQVEDSMVSNPDVAASNGVIHSVDKVMVPESLDGFADLDED